MRFGGWWRLWIAMSAAYAIAVAVGTYVAWPSSAGIAHHPAFDYQLSAEAVAVLNRPNRTDAQGWESAPHVLQMPNGHKFRVAADTSKESSELLAREYVRILDAETSNQRLRALGKAGAVWLMPVLAFCVLGLTIRWINRGFKEHGH